MKNKKVVEVVKHLEQSKLTVLPNANSFIDKLDGTKKDFVLLYTQLNGNITNTCIGVKINRQTFYNWIEKDQDFALAIADADASLNDEMRDLLINKAASGSTPELIFYLKKRHPDFKDQPQVLVQNNFNQNIDKEKGEFDE